MGATAFSSSRDSREGDRPDVRTLRLRLNFSTVLGAIFVIALALRLTMTAAFEGFTSPPNATAQPDQLDYEFFAYQMSRGAGYVTAEGEPTARRPPGTSLALLPVYAALGRSFALGRFWFCLLSALTCVAAGWLARECYGPAVGVVASVWLALYPGHFYYPIHFVSEVPYGLWLTVACVLTIRGFRGRSSIYGSNILAGACWGLAILTRPQLMLAAPIAVLMLQARRRFVTRHVVAALIVQLTIVALLLVPWVLRNAIALGKPTVSTVGGYTFWGGNNAVVDSDPHIRGSWFRTSDLVDRDHPLIGTEIEREAAAWKYGLRFVTEHLARMPGLTAMKVWRLVSPFEDTTNSVLRWTFAAAWLFALPFVAIGIILALRNSSTCSAILLTPLLATLATSMVFYGSVRFRDSIIPLLLVLASRSLIAVGEARGLQLVLVSVMDDSQSVHNEPHDYSQHEQSRG
jgi:4-amino-4-deoxy-L-arabinose transferase-like glycosyltransferase